MEVDRYQQNHAAYIIAMVSFVVSMSALLYAIYIFPHLVFGWRYEVPGFISSLRIWLVEDFALSTTLTSWVIVLTFFFIGIVSGICSYIASSRIENAIFASEIKSVETENTPAKSQSNATRSLFFIVKMILFLILAYLATVAFQWLLSIQ